MTLWENLFAGLVLAILIPAIWLSQTHAYLTLQKTVGMQHLEAAEQRLVEDFLHGYPIPQTVEEAGNTYAVHLTDVPDAQAQACRDEIITLVANGGGMHTVTVPKCTNGIFAS